MAEKRVTMTNTPHPEDQHISIISDIIANGDRHVGRNGAYRSLFMKSMKFDVTPNTAGEMPVPVSTTAGTFLRGVIAEFESFFIRGESDSKILEEDGVNIWRDNTTTTGGVIGPAYGHNYRNYGGTYDESGGTRDGVDQVERLIDEAYINPASRRLIILNSDPRVNDDCVLHPCQMLFQVYLSPVAPKVIAESTGMFIAAGVTGILGAITGSQRLKDATKECVVSAMFARDAELTKKKEGSPATEYRLDIHAYNRSSDIACAGMWNTAFATLVAGYISHRLTRRGMRVTPRYVHVTFANVHVYENQISVAHEHISRKPTGTFPTVVFKDEGGEDMSHPRVVVARRVSTEYSGLRYPLNA